jgi:hypothetical protein
VRPSDPLERRLGISNRWWMALAGLTLLVVLALELTWWW